MRKEINSKIFGKVILLPEDAQKYKFLKTDIENYPVNAFSILNKILNSKGLMLSISKIPNQN